MSQLEIKIGSKVDKSEEVIKQYDTIGKEKQYQSIISQSHIKVSTMCEKKLPNFHRPDQDLSTDTLTRSESQLQFGIMFKKVFVCAVHSVQ